MAIPTTENPTQLAISEVKDIAAGLDENRVSNFAYDDTAFNSDEVAGVAVFDVDANQNVPDKDHTDLNPTVIAQGMHTQAASFPRSMINHFFGRISYNLNKVINKLVVFFTTMQAALAHNSNEYDPNAHYAGGDICYQTLASAPFTRTLYMNTSGGELLGDEPPSGNWTEVPPSLTAVAAGLINAGHVSGVTPGPGGLLLLALGGLSSTPPGMDGVASAGGSNIPARADHIHPSDDSKLDAAATVENSLRLGGVIPGAGWLPALEGSYSIGGAGGEVIVADKVYDAFAADFRIIVDAVGPVAVDISAGAVTGNNIIVQNRNTGNCTITFETGLTLMLAGRRIITVMWDGAHWVMVNVSGAHFDWVFNAGSGNFIPPVSGSYDVWVVGGGGGGGGTSGASGFCAAGSGGGGGYAKKCVWLVAGTAYPYVVGPGGAGSYDNGSGGGNSTFNDGVETITGGGGAPGDKQMSTGVGGMGAGGGASGGDINTPGGVGSATAPSVSTPNTRVGGASALALGVTSTVAGAGVANGDAGNVPGGGATGAYVGGSGLKTGGNGGPGLVSMEL